MAKVRQRGTTSTLSRWVSSLQCQDSDELILLNSGMTRSVITRWPASGVAADIGAWSESVDALCSQDADARGGVCSYDLEHRRGQDVRATYLVRRIAAGGAKSSDAPASIEGVVGMLMKHLEARDKTNQQLVAAMQTLTTSMVGTLIERLQTLEGERREMLITERDAMMAQLAASNDVESRERMDEKLGKLMDMGMAQLASAAVAPKKNGASSNKKLTSSSK